MCLGVVHIERRLVIFEREIRDLSHVPRWAIARTIKGQNVAEHSFYVAIYALQIAEIIGWGGAEERHDLLAYALTHDLHESFTGDTPGPVKRNVYADEKSHAWIAQETERRFPTPTRLYTKDNILPEMRSILKVANLLDELFFLLGEQQMGNMAVYKILESVKKRAFRAWKSLPGYSEDDLKNKWFQHVDPAMFREAQGHSEIVVNDADLAVGPAGGARVAVHD